MHSIWEQAAKPLSQENQVTSLDLRISLQPLKSTNQDHRHLLNTEEERTVQFENKLQALKLSQSS